MDINTLFALRLTGFAGILGAVLFMLGDLLYNHIPGSTESQAVKMSRLPEKRLLDAGILGYIGCWMYTLASLHGYLALRPLGEELAWIFLIAFGATMIGYGIAHTAYYAIAPGAKTAAQLGGDVESGGGMGMRFYRRVVFITYIPVAAASLALLYGMISGSSLYPRWMVLFSPVVLYVLKKPVTGLLKGRSKELVRDSYDNFVLFVFYVLSTVVLWNGKFG